MSPVSTAPVSYPVRLLAAGGVIGLAILTLQARGATLMFATPWTYLLVGVIATPPVIMLLRLLDLKRSFRRPSAFWLILVGATLLIPLFSALLSSYRGPSLLAASVPVSAACLFLFFADWLSQEPDRNRMLLGRALTISAALVALVSTIYWLSDVSTLTADQIFSRVLFDTRNPHPLGHSNYTAGLMLLALPWLLASVWQSTGSYRLISCIAASLALLCLFMSGSRGGLLGLGAMGVAGLFLAGVSRKRFLLIAAGLVGCVIVLAVANPRIRSMLGTGDPFAEPNLSNVQRSAMFEAGLAMGLDRPLLGWGPGTTPLTYPRYRHTLAGGTENILQLHSTPVQLWAETGGLSLLATGLFCGLIFVHRRRAPLAATTLAGYGVFALTDYQLDIPVFVVSVAVMTALMASPSAKSATPRQRWSLGLLILVTTGLIVGLGARDRTPLRNTEALTIAKDPIQHDHAVELLNESLALNPDQEIAHFNLGWLLLVSDPVRAEQHFLAAAHLVPDKGGVYFGLGLARMNQDRNTDAAHAFALECLNEPLFLASPWWTVPVIAAHREATTTAFIALLKRAQEYVLPGGWAEHQTVLLTTLAPRLGQVSPGPERAYRRERIGYPVLMRNLDLPIPTDLYVVREDPRFPASVAFPLPSKGWLPSTGLLKLLDPAPPVRQ